MAGQQRQLPGSTPCLQVLPLANCLMFKDNDTPSRSVLLQCQVQLDQLGQTVANPILLPTLLARQEDSRSNAWLSHSSS